MPLADSPRAFLSARPEWTLAGALLSCHGAAFTIEQTPFRLIDGIWESEALVTRPDAPSESPTRVVLRVEPETLRRWKQSGINPFLEACAQLQDHLQRESRHGHLSALTLL